jgi:DNA-binding NarL/FixJ family response regulator
LLADDHELYREQVRKLLAGDRHVQIIGDATDGLLAIQRVLELGPDLVLIDVQLPGIGGIEATRRIVASFPGVKVVALTLHRSRAFVDGMLGAGAAGYVLKDSHPGALREALRTVANGGSYLSPELDPGTSPSGHAPA